MRGHRKRAIIIGLSRYSHLPSSDIFESNARGMLSVLQAQGFEIKDEYVLIGKVPYIRLRNRVVNFLSNSDVWPDDTLLVYYSGHAVTEDGEAYLSSSDSDPHIPRLRGIGLDELSTQIDMCNSQRVMVMLDCSYTGAAPLSK